VDPVEPEEPTDDDGLDYEERRDMSEKEADTLEHYWYIANELRDTIEAGWYADDEWAYKTRELLEENLEWDLVI